MGRIRSIKPEFFRSRSLAACTPLARLTFAGLWTEADDHGRGIADERLLKGAIWPLDDDVTPGTVLDHLAELEKTEHIRLYEVDGERFYEVVNWEKHQAAAYRRGIAVHPAPPQRKQRSHRVVTTRCESVQDGAEKVLEQGTGNREQGTGSAQHPAAARTKSPPPDSLPFSDRLRTWSTRAGFDDVDHPVEIEAFLEKSRAKGYRNVDWESAYESWCRQGRGYGTLHLTKPGSTAGYYR